MIKRIFTLSSTIFYFFGCGIQKPINFAEITSPNGSLVLKIKNDKSQLFYTLFKNGSQIIDNSKLGLISDAYAIDYGLSIIKKKERRKHHTWKQVWGEQKTLIDHHTELELLIASELNNFQTLLRFRLFDDGLGFRYEVPKLYDNTQYRIVDELTEFNLSEDSPSWWIPAYAYRRYEFFYLVSLIF